MMLLNLITELVNPVAQLIAAGGWAVAVIVRALAELVRAWRS